MLRKLKRPVNERYNSTGYGWKTQLFVTWPVNKCAVPSDIFYTIRP